jgi:hypothetical protein
MKTKTLIALLLAALPAFAQITLPWHQEGADSRTVSKR